MSYVHFTGQNLVKNGEVLDSVVIQTTMVNEILVWGLWHDRNIILYEKNFQSKLFFGSQICTNHRKQLSNQTKSASIESNPPEIHDKCSSDSVYVPEHFETKPENRKVLNKLPFIIEKCPMKFQISKPASTLQPSTLHNIKKKVNAI